MARPNKIINIGISWTGFLLAVIISLCVVLILLWINRCKSLELYVNTKKMTVIEPFIFRSLGRRLRRIGKRFGRFGSKAINAVFGRGRRRAVSTCKPASIEPEKPTEKEIAKPLPELSCGSIADRTKKPTPAQVDLVIQAIAIKFTKIFNDNSNPNKEASDKARNMFINLIVRQCESSKETKYEDIRDKLTNKTEISIDEARNIVTTYPCVRTFIDSMSLRIQEQYIDPVVEEEPESDISSGDTVSYEPAQGEQIDSAGTVNESEDMEDAELEEILKDIDPDLEDKFSEIIYSTCEPLDSCITGALVDDVYDTEFNELAKLYSENLAFDLFMTSSTIYKDPKNKETIMAEMIPLPKSESVTSSTSRFSCADFKASFGS